MNKPRLFWHLIKFHFINVPLLMWLLLLAIFAILAPVQWFATSVNPLSDNSMITSQLYFFILAAQVSWGLSGRRNVACAQMWATGCTDFLWTRPVDRSLLFWAKLAVFALVCSSVAANVILPQVFESAPVQERLWKSPPNESFKQRALATPGLGARIVEAGKEAAPGLLVLERGRIVLAGFSGAKILFISLLTLWVAVTFRLRVKWLFVVFGVFLTAFLAVTLAPLFFRNSDLLAWSQYREQVLLYARHAPVIWSALLALGALVVWDTRRRYMQPA